MKFLTTQFEEELFKSFGGIIKNGGFFKSPAQAKFFAKRYSKQDNENYLSVKEARKGFPDAKYYIDLNGTYSWTDYGTASKIPVTFVFAFDEYGIIGKIKIPYSGNLKIGAYPDFDRTSVVFQREGSIPEALIVAPEPTKTVQEVPVSEFVGAIGERKPFLATLLKMSHFTSNFRTHYGDSGYRTIATLKTEDGSILTHFGSVFYEVGTVFKFVATVKEHSLFEGKKKTIITRPSKVEIVTN